MARHRGLSLLLLVLLAPAFVGPRGRSPPRAARVARVAQRSAELKRDGDGAALGAVGIGASLVMGWSEWTLKTTGRDGSDKAVFAKGMFNRVRRFCVACKQ